MLTIAGMGYVNRINIHFSIIQVHIINHLQFIYHL